MRRTLGTVAIVAALGAVSASPMSAADGHAGRVGEHRLRDAPGSEGVSCVFEHHPEFISLDTVSVRPPVVFGLPRANGASSEVGWRARLQGRDTDGWHTVDVRPVEHATATVNQRARFSRQRFDVSPSAYPAAQELRVVVDMVWYNADGSRVVGGDAQVVHHYAAVDHDGDEVAVAGAACQWGYN